MAAEFIFLGSKITVDGDCSQTRVERIAVKERSRCQGVGWVLGKEEESSRAGSGMGWMLGPK